MTFQEFKEQYQKKEVQEISSSVSKNPMVSVLVQTYQQKDYIRECLDSLLIQETTFDFEILIGDDGSTDGTRETCLEYTEKNPTKVRLFLHHRENQIQVMGEPTSNFNAFYNFYSARGKYMAFCEGDDKWNDKYYLQNSIDFLEKNKEFVLSYHKYEIINPYGHKLSISHEVIQPESDMEKEDLSRVKHHPLLLCTCFRKDIKEIPIELIEVINIDTFIFSLLGEYGKAKFLDSINPSLYRKHIGGIWSKRKKEKKSLSKIITYKKLGDYYKEKKNKPLQTHYKNLQLNNYKMLLMQQIKFYKFKSSIKTLTQYLKTKYNFQ